MNVGTKVRSWIFFPRYSGKAGIDHLIWELTQGLSPTNPDVRENLAKAIGDEIPKLDEETPVLLVSPDTSNKTINRRHE